MTSEVLKDGRNLVSIPLHVGEVYGNITGLMYYYTEVLVGSSKNASRQALILDTGSHLTAFPCKGVWKHCGKHIYQPFDFKGSSTAKLLDWNEFDCKWGKNNECLFRQSYDEGSVYEGFFLDDEFNIGEINGKKFKENPRFRFACVTKETNLFYSQQVRQYFTSKLTISIGGLILLPKKKFRFIPKKCKKNCIYGKSSFFGRFKWDLFVVNPFLLGYN